MGRRKDVREVMSSTISFAELARATAFGTVFVSEHEDDDDSDECEWYGNPGVQCMPPAGADAQYVDLEGERVVQGVRETRWLVAMEEGDTVLRALGADTRAFVKLKKDGTVEVNGLSVLLGDNTATAYVALASLVTAQFNFLKAALVTAAAAIIPADGGAAFATSLNTTLSPWPLTVASTRVKSL